MSSEYRSAGIPSASLRAGSAGCREGVLALAAAGEDARRTAAETAALRPRARYVCSLIWATCGPRFLVAGLCTGRS